LARQLSHTKSKNWEAAKTRLLIVLCCIWICLGLVGHQPWKPNESTTVSIVKAMLSGEHLIDPTPVGEKIIKNPPLYYLSAAGLAKSLSPILDMHDASADH
jgi:4-amino-4-deoxy-L-arabinose transferase-like glycosyltransferase